MQCNTQLHACGRCLSCSKAMCCRPTPGILQASIIRPVAQIPCWEHLRIHDGAALRRVRVQGIIYVWQDGMRRKVLALRVALTTRKQQRRAYCLRVNPSTIKSQSSRPWWHISTCAALA